jgi:hypothetical protein
LDKTRKKRVRRSESKIVSIDGEEVILKCCTSCNKFKALDNFHKSKKELHGRRSYCVPCERERRNGKIVKNISYVIYLKINDEFIEGKICTQCKVPKTKDNFVTSKVRCQRCLRDMWIEYNEENEAKRKEYNEAYAKSEVGKQKINLRGHNRRALVNSLPHTLTYEQYNDIMNEWEWKCAISGEMDGISLDHFIPVTSGYGGTTYENMIPLVKYLNSSKSNNNPFEWFERNKERFDLCEERFLKVIDSLAKKNSMTIEEYTTYVDSCFTNE